MRSGMSYVELWYCKAGIQCRTRCGKYLPATTPCCDLSNASKRGHRCDYRIKILIEPNTTDKANIYVHAGERHVSRSRYIDSSGEEDEEGEGESAAESDTEDESECSFKAVDPPPEAIKQRVVTRSNTPPSSSIRVSAIPHLPEEKAKGKTWLSKSHIQLGLLLATQKKNNLFAVCPIQMEKLIAQERTVVSLLPKDWSLVLVPLQTRFNHDSRSYWSLVVLRRLANDHAVVVYLSARQSYNMPQVQQIGLDLRHSGFALRSFSGGHEHRLDDYENGAFVVGCAFKASNFSFETEPCTWVTELSAVDPRVVRHDLDRAMDHYSIYKSLETLTLHSNHAAFSLVDELDRASNTIECPSDLIRIAQLLRQVADTLEQKGFAVQDRSCLKPKKRFGALDSSSFRQFKQDAVKFLRKTIEHTEITPTSTRPFNGKHPISSVASDSSSFERISYALFSHTKREVKCFLFPATPGNVALSNRSCTVNVDLLTVHDTNEVYRVVKRALRSHFTAVGEWRTHRIYYSFVDEGELKFKELSREEDYMYFCSNVYSLISWIEG